MKKVYIVFWSPEYFGDANTELLRVFSTRALAKSYIKETTTSQYTYGEHTITVEKVD